MTWPALLGLLVFGLLVWAQNRGRRLERQRLQRAGWAALNRPAAVWKVTAEPAQHWVRVTDYDENGPLHERIDVNTSIQVRLEAPTEGTILIATIDVNATDYEEQLAGALVKAHDRLRMLTELERAARPP